MENEGQNKNQRRAGNGRNGRGMVVGRPLWWDIIEVKEESQQLANSIKA